tara:strand:+ start:1494 stop:1634 length:141 start_codon:yes stop_codon:yes gene_type:complete
MLLFYRIIIDCQSSGLYIGYLLLQTARYCYLRLRYIYKHHHQSVMA